MRFSALVATSLVAYSPFVVSSPAILRPRADLRGFDLSQPQSADFWSCAKDAGYGKAVIRYVS